MLPIRNEIYTLEQILFDLEIDDSPCLQVMIDNICSSIQHSHLTDDDLLSVPGFKNTKWKYKYTTRECIPVFIYTDEHSISTFVNIEPLLDYITGDLTEYNYITPKGFYLEQVNYNEQ